MRTIHQFVAGFSNGDAISNEARVLRDIFRSWGYNSEIYCETKRILPELRRDAKEISEYPTICSPDDIVLLHLSIGSIANDIFSSLPCRKAILYHNVTPSRYFEFINKNIARDLSRGRDQLKALTGIAQVNMADSRYNARELEMEGYTDVKVLPLVLDLEKLRLSPDRKIMRKYNDGAINVLFVGRCVPNKKIEDILKTFYFFHEHVEPNSRLIHVGSFSGTESYHSVLVTQVRELGLKCVSFEGSVSQGELNAFYKSADIFLCMSEHEGFCIPIIESMATDVPVIAFDACAVPETMDGAGIIFKEKDHRKISELMGRITKETPLRESILKGQRKRLDRFINHNLEQELKQHLKPLL